MKYNDTNTISSSQIRGSDVECWFLWLECSDMSSVMLFGSCIEGAVLRDKYVCLCHLSWNVFLVNERMINRVFQVRWGGQRESGYWDAGVAVALGHRLRFFLLHLWGGASEFDWRSSSSTGHSSRWHCALFESTNTNTFKLCSGL